jgi:dienelactone hydrolase
MTWNHPAFSSFGPLSRLLLLAALAPGLAACGDEGGSAPPPPAATTPDFALAVGPMALGDIPWPDDLYRNADGRIVVSAVPGEGGRGDAEFLASLRTTLGELDGFGQVSPVFFTFSGPLDPTSLPATTAASATEAASAFLLDADTGSDTPLARVPVEARWNAARSQLALRPADGHPLREGGLYAAVLTDAVRDADGAPLAAHPRFAAIRDAEVRPADPAEAAAWSEYAPVLDTLESMGLPRTRVVGLAVFHVQTVTDDLQDARAIVRAIAAPVATVREAIVGTAALDARLGVPEMPLAGSDVPGGVLHTHVRAMVHGTIPSPSFASPGPGRHGRFERDTAGALVVKRTEDVPYTLFIPEVSDLSALPLLVFQHGLGGNRGNALGIVDACAEAGWAVVAIDAPYHGLRAAGSAPDFENGFTGAPTPDGFGDATGTGIVLDFTGISDEEGELVAFSPLYFRDALRQAVVDLMAVTHTMRNGDLRAVREADPALATLGFASSRVAFVGVSLGGIIGTMFAATETDVGAALLNVTGGSIVRFVTTSPAYATSYLPILLQRFGLRSGIATDPNDPAYFYEESSVWQTLFDRGDSIGYARLLRERDVDVLMQMAENDESLHNVGTESLARAARIPMLDATPRYADVAMGMYPARANVELVDAGRMATRGLAVFAPASHGMLTSRRGAAEVEHPVVPPFREVSPSVMIDNPVDAAQRQMLHFFESWRMGMSEIAAPVAPRP